MTLRATPWRNAALLLFLTSLIGACATPQSPVDPHTQALQKVHGLVENGVEEGFKKSEKSRDFVVKVRQNPCDCAAPDTEVFTHERWTRVYLNGDEELLETFTSRAADAQTRGEFPDLRIRGAYTGSTQKSDRGLEYPVFKALELVD